jgi:DNA-binding GntR family transcriptional regulator
MNVPESPAARLASGWAGIPTHSPAATSLTKSEYAYTQLRRSILENELAAGTVLDQEPLARSLGVSTTPVREALRRLEAEHLVVSRAHRETVVAPVTPEFVEEIFQIRLALDPLAAELATVRATEDDLALIASFRPGPPGRATGVERFHFSRHLHRAIYTACGNTRLVEILEQLWDVSDRRRFATLKSQRAIAASHTEHVQIIDAVLARDAARVRKLMLEHVDNNRAAISDGLGHAC